MYGSASTSSYYTLLIKSSKMVLLHLIYEVTSVAPAGIRPPIISLLLLAYRNPTKRHMGSPRPFNCRKVKPGLCYDAPYSRSFRVQSAEQSTSAISHIALADLDPRLYIYYSFGMTEKSHMLQAYAWDWVMYSMKAYILVLDILRNFSGCAPFPIRWH
jgi:hypothetical protein